MTFVITQPCIDVQDQSCVEVCPVDCIHYEEGADRMLFIEPATCIDCGACEPACPVTAIFDEPDVPGDQQQFTEINELWFTDAAAARAKVADIPALEEAVAAAAGSNGAVAESAGVPGTRRPPRRPQPRARRRRPSRLRRRSPRRRRAASTSTARPASRGSAPSAAAT